MITLVLPIAGNGSRFIKAGYKTPKPFINVLGMTMIERCIDNMPKVDKIIVIHLAAHAEFARQIPNAVLRELKETTKGEACTVYEALGYVSTDSELLIADCDQWLDWSPDHFLRYVRSRNCDGAMTIFHGLKSHWSFVHLTPDMWVESVVEKVPISDHAVSGVRYFRNAGRAFDAIGRMISEPVVGEYYLGNVYNDLIHRGDKILAYPVPRVYSMGTPDELQATMQSAPMPMPMEVG